MHSYLYLDYPREDVAQFFVPDQGLQTILSESHISYYITQHFEGRNVIVSGFVTSGNLFTITGCMNCVLWLGGRKIS